MSEKPQDKELKKLRRELDDVRAEYESYKEQTIALQQSRDPTDSIDFPTLFPGMIAGELRRRSAFLRIKRRLSALERRLTEIEAAERANA